MPMILDAAIIVEMRQNDLLAEAERERLAARLPKSHSTMRHDLASACLRLAVWLDGTGEQVPGAADNEYVRGSKSGPSDWAAGQASV